MEKIQENICKQACSYVFVQENYIKAHVLMYFLHLVLTFIPHYIIMVKGLYQLAQRWTLVLHLKHIRYNFDCKLEMRNSQTRSVVIFDIQI